MRPHAGIAALKRIAIPTTGRTVLDCRVLLILHSAGGTAQEVSRPSDCCRVIVPIHWLTRYNLVSEFLRVFHNVGYPRHHERDVKQAFLILGAGIPCGTVWPVVDPQLEPVGNAPVSFG